MRNVGPDATTAVRRTPGVGRLAALGLVGVAAASFSVYKAFEATGRGRADPAAPSAWVSLEEGPPEQVPLAALPDEATRPALRVAVAPVISPEESSPAYRRLVEYVGRKLDRTPELILRPTYLQINELVRNGRCELAFVCTYAFVRGEQEFEMQALVVPQVGGSTTYRSLVLVPRASRAGSLLDLRGQRFASADILSTSGWLFPALWLRERGQDANAFFSEHVLTGGHDRSLRAVSSGLVEGAAVDSLVLEAMTRSEPALVARTRVLLASPPLGAPPFVVPPRLEPALRAALERVLVGMDRDPEGSRLLAALRIDRFVVPDPTLFDEVRAMVRSWEAR